MCTYVENYFQSGNHQLQFPSWPQVPSSPTTCTFSETQEIETFIVALFEIVTLVARVKLSEIVSLVSIVTLSEIVTSVTIVALYEIVTVAKS